MKRLTVLLIAILALAVASIPIAGALATGGPQASVAKKKCKKAKKGASSAKKKKCKKGGSGGGSTNDIATATGLFAGSRFSASGCTSTANCNRSYTYVLAFCANSTYQARFELNDGITGNTFVDRFSGSWKFSAANVAAGTATLSYTIDTWQSDAGTAQPAHDQNSQVIAKSATSFVIDGVEYTRTPGAAGC